LKPKTVIADFRDVGGGLNTSDDMLQIRKNQVQQSLDAELYKDGVFRRPGSEAGDAVLATNGRGMHVYDKIDGTELILFMSAGKLYSTPTNLDSKTELFDLTGTGKASFANYLDKCWVCNGTENVKVEGTTAYQIGISPPSGVGAAASAGGTIPDGTYAVYACYARNVGGVPVLFSVGESVGNVVLGGGDNTILITSFANSSDGQVGNKVIFLTEPAGSTVFYHETNNNTTTTFNITSQANRDTTTVYSEVAEENTRTSAFEHIIAFDGSIYGSVANVLYRSIKSTTNVYDLERFVSSLVLPFDINGMFQLGEHLYLNTTGGIIVLPYGDINTQWDKLTDDYFFDINTVAEIPSRGVVGVTHQNVRIFNGEKFLSHDISEDVKNEIENIYTTTTSFSPFGFVVRGERRLEYHLSYNDSSLGATSNNVHLVLNVDKIQLLPNSEVIAPWEMWSNGFNYAATDKSQVAYFLQDHTTPILYKLNKNNTYDNGIYLNDGSLGTSSTAVVLTVTYRAHMENSFTYVRWFLLRMIAKVVTSVNVYLYIRESITGANEAKEIAPGGGSSVWSPSDDDELVWDEGYWGTDELTMASAKTKDNMKGYIMYLKMVQSANDPNFHVLQLEAQGASTHDYSTEMP
jgi:hypothetical protein